MNNELTLYECSDLIQQIEAKAEESVGEISEEDWQKLILAQTTSMAKMENLVNYICRLDSFCDTCDAEIKRIQERKRIEQNRVKSIKDFITPFVAEKKGGYTVGTHKLSIRTSKGVLLAEGFNNPMYCNTKTEIVPDKKKIKESIDAGVHVMGAVLETRNNLQIK